MSKETKQLREKTVEGLREELLSLRREQFNLKMQKAVQQSSKTSELGRVRRAIARVLTILVETERKSRQ